MPVEVDELQSPETGQEALGVIPGKPFECPEHGHLQVGFFTQHLVGEARQRLATQHGENGQHALLQQRRRHLVDRVHESSGAELVDARQCPLPFHNQVFIHKSLEGGPELHGIGGQKRL